MYFDSDSFAQYATRLRRDEGAQLFRVRWYVRAVNDGQCRGEGAPGTSAHTYLVHVVEHATGSLAEWAHSE